MEAESRSTNRMSTTITRRQLIGGAAGLQLGLFLSQTDRALFRLLSGAGALSADTAAAQSGEGFALGAFLQIEPDGTVTITISKPDIGQGLRTSFAMLIAEDLEADWDRVRVEQAPASDQFGSQGIGGSFAVRGSWQALRGAGAAARSMLVAAAAERWGVDAGDCEAEKGVVRHPASGREMGYGELAEGASSRPVPQNVPLKDWSECTIVGRPTARVDNRDVVTGRAGYGLDARPEGLRFAVIARPSALGARLTGHDEAAAMAVPGVLAVLPGVAGGVAVVAENSWAAMQGRQALAAEWDTSENAGLNNASIRQQLVDAVADAPEMPGSAAKTVEAGFDLPYLAHAMMEPHNCTVDASSSPCQVWAPTQNPQSVRRAISRGLGVEESEVVVHTTLAGGGFGRRIDTAAASEAAAVSRQIGAPVQMLWTRDDDLQQAAYRPASHHAMRGALDADGRAIAWSHRFGMSGRGRAAELSADDAERMRLQGLDGTDQGRGGLYDIPGFGQEKVEVGTPVPTTFWRSVDHGNVNFATECFVDLLAEAAEVDPIAFRKQHIADPRMLAVLDAVSEMSSWGEQLPPGRGRGVACFDGYGAVIAHVVEVEVAPEGQVRATRIWAAVDPGVAINPLGVVAQVEGAAIDGLSTALSAELTIEGGAIQESSFFDYRWLRIDQAPPTDVRVMPSGGSPSGMGEVGYPSVGPAVANAVFAATGKRPTGLPIRPAELAGWAEGLPTPTPTATPVPPEPTATPRPEGSTIYLPDLRSGE